MNPMETVRDKHFQQFDHFVRVYFQEPKVGYSDFHYYWLRHNCNCKPHCRHVTTNERVIDSSQIPMDIKPLYISVSVNTNKEQTELLQNVTPLTLEIEWSPIAENLRETEPHRSVYEWSWLQTHAYSWNNTIIDSIPHDLSSVEVHYDHYLQKYPAMDDPHLLSEEGQIQYRKHVGSVLKQYGLVVLRKRGLDTEAIISDLLPSDKQVIETHFGRIEDLRTANTTNKNTDQLGYTNSGVDLHTDQPFIENPPGMQLLQ